jgi:hypothetical protein
VSHQQKDLSKTTPQEAPIQKDSEEPVFSNELDWTEKDLAKLERKKA